MSLASTSAKATILLLASACLAAHAQRAERYVEFDPPTISPDPPRQTVKSGSNYDLRCEGRRRGVSWRLPADASEGLRSRVELVHKVERRTSDDGR